tara:strand:- start:3471 stop:4748 length:1278 start_codon:yes stop_codon:yes gene_type:complete
MDYKREKIAIIGLGYVGLPLAVAFSKEREVLAFDIDLERINSLSNGVDETLEVDTNDLKDNVSLVFSNDEKDLGDCGVFIITVPTPINNHNKPDLRPLVTASEMVGKYLKKNSLVIYESTVYPGATEEICVPVLEKESGLIFNSEFYCGYSPERINPGDKNKRLSNIVKIVSGSTLEITDSVDELYSSIIEAGTYKVSSIKVAEAAKVIENTQRDLNIALINELSMLFNKLGLNTNEILEAAETKWNFVPFRPGLVGGHCIGIDPYYLTYKAEEIGFNTELILAGRKINDAMANFVVEEAIKKLLDNSLSIENSEFLILGFSFKENCRDIRNTKVNDIVKLLESKNVKVSVYDPWIDRKKARGLYNINFLETLPTSGTYSAVIIAVAHEDFKQLEINQVRGLLKKNGVVYDIKSIFPQAEVDGTL